MVFLRALVFHSLFPSSFFFFSMPWFSFCMSLCLLLPPSPPPLFLCGGGIRLIDYFSLVFLGSRPPLWRRKELKRLWSTVFVSLSAAPTCRTSRRVRIYFCSRCVISVPLSLPYNLPPPTVCRDLINAAKQKELEVKGPVRLPTKVKY